MEKWGSNGKMVDQNGEFGGQNGKVKVKVETLGSKWRSRGQNEKVGVKLQMENHVAAETQA